ncbi:hypothetical protein AMTR_s00023p00228360, partial [Amborella trichopoda]
MWHCPLGHHVLSVGLAHHTNPDRFPPSLDDASFKNFLQEETQNEEDPSLPVYSVEVLGTAHCRIFRALVVVRGHTFSGGQCFTGKEAKQTAAKEAYSYAKAVGFDPTPEESLMSENRNLTARLVQEVSNTQQANEEISLLKHEILSLTTQFNISSYLIVDRMSAMPVCLGPLLSG